MKTNSSDGQQVYAHLNPNAKSTQTWSSILGESSRLTEKHGGILFLLLPCRRMCILVRWAWPEIRLDFIYIMKIPKRFHPTRRDGMKINKKRNLIALQLGRLA